MVISHDLASVLRMADRIAVLDDERTLAARGPDVPAARAATFGSRALPTSGVAMVGTLAWSDA